MYLYSVKVVFALSTCMYGVKFMHRCARTDHSFLGGGGGRTLYPVNFHVSRLVTDTHHCHIQEMIPYYNMLEKNYLIYSSFLFSCHHANEALIYIKRSWWMLETEVPCLLLTNKTRYTVAAQCVT